MKKLISLCCLVVTTAVFADTKEAAAAPDMSKMGPAARKPSDEKKTKKEIAEFFKKAEEAEKQGAAGFDAMVAMNDFPLFMATDDLKGAPESKLYTKDEYVAMMKPAMDNMPKDMKITHKPTVTVLSDSLASVVDEYTMTMGKMKLPARNNALLVKVGGEWKWKTMVEAGWGGMSAPAPAAEPAKTEAAKPAPAAAPAAAPAKK